MPARCILDTNILVSALIVPGGIPAYLYQCWRTGLFTLITSEDQLDELRRVTRYPRVRKYIRPAAAGAMVNEIRALAKLTGQLPSVTWRALWSTLKTVDFTPAISLGGAGSW